MSLYRRPGRHRLRVSAALAGAALGLGAVAGFVVARSGEERPSVQAALTGVQEELAPALEGLELVAIEYREAVDNGRVVATTEYKAARQDLARARDAHAQVASDLVVLDGPAAREAARSLDRAGELIGERAPARKVIAESEAAAAALRKAARLGGER